MAQTGAVVISSNRNKIEVDVIGSNRNQIEVVVIGSHKNIKGIIVIGSNRNQNCTHANSIMTS